MIKIVLYQPEKPGNIGNILRTANATEIKVIIIGPLSFTLDDKSLKRAGMDYIPLSSFEIYDSYEDFYKDYKDKEIYYVTRYASKAYSSFDLSDVTKEYIFMFGRESTGIPYDILKAHLNHCMRIPMAPQARSLNLSNSVAIIVYEALRQVNFYNLSTKEVLKGEDFLTKD